ncbi:hypothetical protein PsorP6_015927 [Peronosclerospora sorghi]|uniref:Uncharacterized protein n=1 Tax=Peronosclerospora sorghi TaxID=230839 RepID=A0ACC0WPN1_9STRA|nr:hypothetical protein PsorP6_015927 [Peronosclerospora sorghi]
MPSVRCVVLLVALATRVSLTGAKCIMTQTCVNPGNVPDSDRCIPHAHPEPVDPKPMTGDGWTRGDIGGGPCTRATDCHHHGTCRHGRCVCVNDGVAAGPFCNETQRQCPVYHASACCSWQQNHALADNFRVVATLFGQNRAGGCDACAANLLALWCGLVCAPTQAQFLTLAHAWPSTSYRPDPLTGKPHVKVLDLNVALDRAYTCAVYASCRHTALASMTSAMASALGFFTYQMQVGAIGHGQFLDLRFPASTNASFGPQNDAPAVLSCANYSNVPRSKLPTQAQTLPSIASSEARDKRCPCGACRATCDAHATGNSSDHEPRSTMPISLFHGFNPLLVASVYGFLAACIVGARHWSNTRV